MGWSIGSELFWLIAFVISFSVALLYDKSPAFRYRLKFALYILNVSITAAVVIPIIMFRPFDTRNMLVAIPLIRPINNLLGIQWKVSGAEILEKEFPCVVICNHQSMLDILGIVQLWPSMKKCAVIGKKEILYVFPFGIMSWLCGTIFINRKNSSQSKSAITTSAEKIQQNKTKMWIFPEGTRSKKGHVLPFKKGAFHIAMMNKLPIVPVVFSPYSFIDDDKKIFDSGTMKIKVLEPIETSNLEYPEDLGKVVHECHEIMDREYQKMLKESQIVRKKHSDSCKFKTSSSNGASCSKDIGANSNGSAIEHAENDIDLHGS